jgi:hypothetical protein
VPSNKGDLLSETTPDRAWRRSLASACAKEECERRGKPEIFERAKQRFLRVLGKTESRIKD